jgi:hypothetical protein
VNGALSYRLTDPFRNLSSNARVVERLHGIRRVIDDNRVELASAAVGELLAEIDGAVEAQAAVGVDVDVQRPEVGERAC